MVIKLFVVFGLHRMSKEFKDNHRRMIMPLVSRAFSVGKARETIASIEDDEERRMALAEYYQYTGDAEKAIVYARPFLNHEDLSLRLSAHIVCFVSGLASLDVDGAKDAFFALENIDLEENTEAVGMYFTNVFKIMLYLKDEEIKVSNNIPEILSEGAKLFVLFILALREYFKDKYENSIGMAKAGLMLGGERYPVAGIYLHLISAASMVRIKHSHEAQKHFKLAYSLASADGFIAPFAMQYIMLAGLNKSIIKPQDADSYRIISRYADNFINAWIGVHNNMIGRHRKYKLTKTEHITETLFRKGLSIKEIAHLMNISVNTVKRHLAVVYQKTGAKRRSDLLKITKR